MDQLLQIVGALLILAAFVALQCQRLAPQSLVYVGLNLVGSAILTVVALIGSDWGFLLLQGVWAIVSAWSLVRLLRGRPPAQRTSTRSGSFEGRSRGGGRTE